MRVIVNFILASCLLVLAAAQCKDESGTYSYTQEKVLDEGSNYVAQTLVDGDYFIVTLSANNGGFLGFGIPEQTSGSMLGADIVTAAVEDNGQLRLRDYYVNYEAFPFAPYGGTVQKGPGDPLVPAGRDLVPREDCLNGGTDDWETLGFTKTVEDGVTCQMITLRRKLTTEDVNDRPITAGLMRFIWALGDSKEPSYHGSKRAGFQMMVDAGEADEFECDPATCFYRDYTVSDYEIPPHETTYLNFDFRLFDENETGIDYHIVYVKEITSDDTLSYVHHLTMNGCYGDSLAGNLNFTHEYYQVYDGNFVDQPICDIPIYVWAVGGNPLRLPDQAGFPAGTDSDFSFKYITINYHYTNPQQETGLFDSSGVRVYYSKVKRQHDAGVLELGAVGDSAVPTQAEPFTVQSHCPTECSTWWPQFKAFASFLHMHSFGQDIWTAQYDSAGNFKRETNRISFWNFEWQLTTDVDITIEPGDSFRTFCTFNTSKWDGSIKFGLSSYDEMCIEFLYIYPYPTHLNLDSRFACGPNNFNPGTPETRCWNNESNTLEYSDIGVDQTYITEGAPGYNSAVAFAAEAEAKTCVASLYSDPQNALADWELYAIIGGSAVGGLLLLAALLFVVLKLRKKNSEEAIAIMQKN